MLTCDSLLMANERDLADDVHGCFLEGARRFYSKRLLLVALVSEAGRQLSEFLWPAN